MTNIGVNSIIKSYVLCRSYWYWKCWRV